MASVGLQEGELLLNEEKIEELAAQADEEELEPAEEIFLAAAGSLRNDNISRTIRGHAAPYWGHKKKYDRHKHRKTAKEGQLVLIISNKNAPPAAAVLLGRAQYVEDEKEAARLTRAWKSAELFHQPYRLRPAVRVYMLKKLLFEMLTGVNRYGGWVKLEGQPPRGQQLFKALTKLCPPPTEDSSSSSSSDQTSSSSSSSWASQLSEFELSVVRCTETEMSEKQGRKVLAVLKRLGINSDSLLADASHADLLAEAPASSVLQGMLCAAQKEAAKRRRKRRKK